MFHYGGDECSYARVKESPSKQLINTQLSLSLSGQNWFMKGAMAILPWQSPLNHLGAEASGEDGPHDYTGPLPEN